MRFLFPWVGYKAFFYLKMGNSFAFGLPTRPTIGDKVIAVIGVENSGYDDVFSKMLFGAPTNRDVLGITTRSALIKNVSAGRFFTQHTATIGCFQVATVEAGIWAGCDYLIFVTKTEAIAEDRLADLRNCFSVSTLNTQLIVAVLGTVEDQATTSDFIRSKVDETVRSRVHVAFLGSGSAKEVSVLKNFLLLKEVDDIKAYNESASWICPAKKKEKHVGILRSSRANV